MRVSAPFETHIQIETEKFQSKKIAFKRNLTATSKALLLRPYFGLGKVIRVTDLWLV